ncbi:carboxypeptidase B-like [Hyalella azteca]|uniref:Carboxypeptidase B-like n=1 Tax=Hyalella azteca TaxID=294128 RepID=A0A8B7NIQ3_HYAAZ|nr:carboxypeptidase B-like [Hyalella azteca]
MSEYNTNGPVEVAVAPPISRDAQEKLRQNDFNVTVVAQDVEQLFSASPSIFRQTKKITDAFLELREVENFLDELVVKHPDQARVKQIGKTENGTPIHMMIIKSQISPAASLAGANNVSPVVFLDSGTHAREWLSVSTSLYAIQQLLEQPSSPARQVEWRIVPVVNPDGYAYSWNTNRLWRKNRKSGIGRCQGVDLNRNYDVNFEGIGSSRRPCSDIFRGPAAFSEPETRAVRDAFLEVRSEVKGYISLHSYSQVIMLPWSYQPDVHPNLKNMTDLGEGMAKAISKARGTKFDVFNTYKSFYPASGTSMDWVASLGVPHSLAIELQDKGHHGFLYPENKIRDAVTEVWKGIEFFAEEIARQSRQENFTQQ